MKEIIRDLKKDLSELKYSNAQKDLEADMGHSYEDMYGVDYIEYLKDLCKKYHILFVEEEIDWEWCNYIHNIQYSIEMKIINELKSIKKEIIEDLNYVYFLDGKHTGKWELDDNEEFRLDLAEKYMNDMKKLADKYSIEYPNRLSNFGLNNYTEKHYLIDMTANEISIAIKTTLKDIILKEML